MLDSVVKQRMVGALVLVALAVIFLPMLFSRPDEVRQVRVDAPAAPQAPTMPQVKVAAVEVPVNQPVRSPASDEPAQAEAAPAMPIAPAPAPPAAPPSKAASSPAKPATAAPPPVPVAPVAGVPARPDTAAKIDPNGVPMSWAVQLASLSSRAGADALQGKLRTQGYNAYVRSADGKNRVFVGPVIERAEAERLRDALNRQQQMKGFVVRFEP